MMPRAVRLLFKGRTPRSFLISTFFLIGLGMMAGAVLADPLPSWNEGPAKQAIVQFVRAVTDKSSPQYVAAGAADCHLRQ